MFHFICFLWLFKTLCVCDPLVIKEINRLSNVSHHESVESCRCDRLTRSSGLAAAGEKMEGEQINSPFIP